MLKRAALMAVPLALAASPGHAQRAEGVYESLTIEDVEQILLLNGLTVISEPVDGENVVADDRVVVDDFSRWHVYLYNCREDGCGDVEFRVAFENAEPELEALNAWNARYRFTRAYRSRDGLAVLSMDVNADGGVTVANFSALIPLWRRSVARFANSLAPAEDG